MIARRWQLPIWLGVQLAALCGQAAHANGRLPGATEIAISHSDPQHMIARATYGMVQTFDGGESWQWICERAINVSGEVDPPVVLTQDDSLVLLPPGRGILVSRDRGCSWQPAPALAAARAVDMTLDPRDPARVLLLLSSVATIQDGGVAAYTNLLMETRDNARTWSEVGRLPSDFSAETIEIAPSDAMRIYVAGTSSLDPRLGSVQRSEDGGKTWTQTRIDLPPGSGSLFISAIHPTDPDRLWLRLPARGDRFGALPVALIMSRDKGQTWAMIAATSKQAMLGFALSPDGARLAYGGPGDGLFIGPSDGSSGFERRSELHVRCLRWDTHGLYACGTAALGDPFSLGISTDEGATFLPTYTIAGTCPQVCAAETGFATLCRDSWSALAPTLRFSDGSCSESWTRDAVGSPGTELEFAL